MIHLWLSAATIAVIGAPPVAPQATGAGGRQAVEQSRGPSAMIVKEADRLFVILWDKGPGWKAGRPVQEQDLAAHRAYFAQLSRDGRVFAAGPFIDAGAGGLALIKAATLSEAVAVMQADPAVQGGVFVGRVRPFFVVFGNGTPDAVAESN